MHSVNVFLNQGHEKLREYLEYQTLVKLLIIVSGALIGGGSFSI